MPLSLGIFDQDLVILPSLFVPVDNTVGICLLLLDHYYSCLLLSELRIKQGSVLRGSVSNPKYWY